MLKCTAIKPDAKPISFKMKMPKTGITSPLQWADFYRFIGDGSLRERHYARNGLKLDVFEINNKNASYKVKLLSDLDDNLIIGKIVDLVNGKIVKKKDI